MMDNINLMQALPQNPRPNLSANPQAQIRPGGPSEEAEVLKPGFGEALAILNEAKSMEESTPAAFVFEKQKSKTETSEEAFSDPLVLAGMSEVPVMPAQVNPLNTGRTEPVLDPKSKGVKYQVSAKETALPPVDLLHSKQQPVNSLNTDPGLAGLKPMERQTRGESGRRSSVEPEKNGFANDRALTGGVEAQTKDPLLFHLRELGGRIEGQNVAKEAVSVLTPARGRTLANRMSGNDFLETVKGARLKEAGPVVTQDAQAETMQKPQALASGEEMRFSLNDQEPALSSMPSILEALSARRLAEKDASDWNVAPVMVEPDGISVVDRAPHPRGNGLPAMELTGHVVQGAMARERLSSQALLGMTSGVRNLQSQGGGEIRIRLKPEHLGELQVQVLTRGRNVGLKIKASDESAKQILEESIKHLRESLASQNLNLAKVDLAVASPKSEWNPSGPGSSWSGQGQSSTNDQPGFNPSFAGWMGETPERGGRQADSWSNGEDNAVAGIRATRSALPSYRSEGSGLSLGRVSGSDRQLDVRA